MRVTCRHIRHLGCLLSFSVTIVAFGTDGRDTKDTAKESAPELRHHTLLQRKSLFGKLEVTEAEEIRYLFVDDVLQTAMYSDHTKVTKECHLGKHYWLELLPYFHPEGKRCLLIGLGGGLLPAVLSGYGIETHAVEIDAKILEVARDYFGYKQSATVDDGRAYLSRCSQQYDFIVIDAFAGADFPYHLATKECFELAENCLSSSGVLALNLISRPRDSRVSASMVRTLGEVFPQAAVYKTELSDRVQSLICFASKKPLTLSLHPHGEALGFTKQQLEETDAFKVNPISPKSVVFTDGNNPLDLEWSREAREWTEIMMDLFGRRQEMSEEGKDNE